MIPKPLELGIGPLVNLFLEITLGLRGDIPKFNAATISTKKLLIRRVEPAAFWKIGCIVRNP